MTKKSKYTVVVFAAILMLTGFIIAQQALPTTTPSPADRGTTEDNLEIRKSSEPALPLRQVADLKVSGFEWVRAKEGSPIGQRGDLILVLTGQGFMEADQRPIVHLGTDLTLGDTYVSEDMTRLYVVVPQLTIKRLERLSLAELTVQNPGALNRDPKRWVSLKLDPATWTTGLRTPREVSFNRGQYFIEIER
ncbi:MAG: hypothetical protein U0176_07520 [Bacteroidia bacterium]